jgi:hypothetical protein
MTQLVAPLSSICWTCCPQIPWLVMLSGWFSSIFWLRDSSRSLDCFFRKGYALSWCLLCGLREFWRTALLICLLCYNLAHPTDVQCGVVHPASSARSRRLSPHLISPISIAFDLASSRTCVRHLCILSGPVFQCVATSLKLQSMLSDSVYGRG